jgi:hypothetical protein
MGGASRRRPTSILTFEQARQRRLKYDMSPCQRLRETTPSLAASVRAIRPSAGDDVTFPAIWPGSSSNAEGVKFIQRACEPLGCSAQSRKVEGDDDRWLNVMTVPDGLLLMLSVLRTDTLFAVHEQTEAVNCWRGRANGSRAVERRAG